MQELTEPPRRGALSNPLVVVVVVVFAIAVVTAALVAANGDDFAKARIPLRPRLPLAAAAPGFVRDGAGSTRGAPAPPREIEVPGALPDPGRTAAGYRLTQADRRSVQAVGLALGFPPPLETIDGQHVMRQGDRRFWADARETSGTRFSVTAGVSDVQDDFEGCDDPTGQIVCSEPQPRVSGGAGVPSEPPVVSTTLAGPGSATSTTPAGPGGTVDPATRARATRVAARLHSALRPLAAAPVVEAQGEQWSVMLPLQVDGQRAEGWEVRVGVDPTAGVRWGAGWLGPAEKIGTYELAGVATGLQRLRKGSVGTTGPTPDMSSRATTGLDAPTQCIDQPQGGALCEVPPVQMPILPKAVITGVHLGLQLTSDGMTSYLVPAYVFTTSQSGEELVVPAITDADAQTSQTSPLIDGRRPPTRVSPPSP